MQINSIIIVGGGSAGWFTAGAISKNFPQIDLTLIESTEIPTIGVGESTLGHINRFFNYLGLEDEDWMKECDATYKVSIAFSDFYKKGQFFQYPFGEFKIPNQFEHVVEWLELKALFGDKVDNKDFVHFLNYNSLLATYNKLSLEENEDYSFSDDVAYHFDAEKFSNFLKNKFCKNIKHYIGTVEEVSSTENGIDYIMLEDKKLKADLYIDCTGFKSILIENKLGVKFKKFDHLINDCAIAARIPFKNEDERKNITNTTICTAMDYGWMWEIPLWNRYGSGYVFSSKFSDFNSIENEFRNKNGFDGPIKRIKFRHGRHESAFEKNVFSVGLAYGFIEPLESTGLLTIHENIILLIDALLQHDCNINYVDKELINFECNKLIDDMSYFVSDHYNLSRRIDTPYWEFSTQQRKDLEIFAIQDKLKITNNNIDGLTCVLIGMNYSPINYNSIINTKGLRDSEKLEKYTDEQISKFKLYENILMSKIKKVSTLNSTYDFLKKYIYD